MSLRPFRFTASAAPGIVSLAEVQRIARLAESTGFSTLVFQDHLPQHATIPLLTAAAAATERIELCPYVLNADFRHPAVVAQDLATLDVLSGGRLVVGIGAGWNRKEYEAVGIPFDSIGVRVARLREAITVIKGCFADGPCSYAGEHYTITEHDGQPKPEQRPGPPFLMGGGGRKMLTLAAREADIVGFSPRLPPGRPGGVTIEPASITVAGTAEKVAWVREAAGERFDDIELSTHASGYPVTVTNNAIAEARPVVDDICARTGASLTVAEFLDSPHIWIGTIPQLTEKCLSLRERLGISHFMIGPLTCAGKSSSNSRADSVTDTERSGTASGDPCNKAPMPTTRPESETYFPAEHSSESNSMAASTTRY